ncbi:MAG TPA: glycosyltransferase [bacterium]|nr:glycosyltransferase [bacterium]
MNIAIVHDWLTNFGGSERCVESFLDLYPDAPLYTTIWDQKEVRQFADAQIITSFLQKFPGSKKHHAFYLNLMPMAFERFDFSDYDVVLSSSHACSKGIITLPETVHICYCYTPTRYLWDFWHNYINNPSYFGIFNFLVRLLAPFAATYLRTWDRAAAERVDYFIAISEFVAQRIKKYYRRDSAVIYPPVDVDAFQISATHDDYFLFISRLVPYKKADLVIEAFNELNLPLKIAGDGPEYSKLKRLAKKNNIEFLGKISEKDKSDLMSRCQAFIFPPEEDFGIAPVEAMAAGRPVIALGKGGALETVVKDVTGVFFAEQNAELLRETVRTFRPDVYDPKVIRTHAQKFSREAFKHNISAFIHAKTAEKKTAPHAYHNR